jgi:flagellum-specific peptidoglycan hydrolase FlgJ
MTPAHQAFLRRALAEATKAQHIFPEMAACEAALESHFGESVLAIQDNNLFGMKAHRHMNPAYGVVNLPTREFENSEWIQTEASWCKYPDWASCFADRITTLKRLASVYPHYAHALEAGSGVTYVREVSQTWSTDPARADKVLTIYDEIAGDWNATA